MRRVKTWIGGTLCLGLLAAAVGGCGGSAESNGDEGSDGGDDSGNNSGAGGSSSGSGTDAGTTNGIVPGDPVAFEDYPAEVSAILCGWLTPCCVGLGLSLTEMDCSTSLGASVGMPYAGADPENYTYDPELAGDCVATARAFYD